MQAQMPTNGLYHTKNDTNQRQSPYYLTSQRFKDNPKIRIPFANIAHH